MGISVGRLYCALEAQTKSCLDLTRRVGLAQEDLAEAGRRDACVRSRKLDAIEGVEELHAEVEAVALCEVEFLGCEHVEVLGAGRTHIGKIPRCIAELERRRGCKGGGVEVEAAVLHRAASGDM